MRSTRWRWSTGRPQHALAVVERSPPWQQLHAVLVEPGEWQQAQDSITTLSGWRYVDGVVSETLRLHPPAAISARKVLRPFDFAGSRVSAGGGTHRCLGATFASTEMTVLLEQLLVRTRLQLESVDPRPVGLTAMRPRRGPFARVLALRTS